MTDAKNETIIIPTDANAVARYRRAESLVNGCILGLLLGFAACFFTLIARMEGKEKRGEEMNVPVMVVQSLGIGLATFAGVAVCVGVCASAFRARGKVSTYAVVGPYLVIDERGFTNTNLKIHFRDLYGYALVQGPLMRRYGLKSIVIAGGGRRPSGEVTLFGVVDAEAWRDRLCELDAAREHASG